MSNRRPSGESSARERLWSPGQQESMLLTPPSTKSEGVFLSEESEIAEVVEIQTRAKFLPDNLNSKVASLEFDRSTNYKDGVGKTYTATMTDGSIYPVKVIDPLERQSNIPVTTGTALFTKLSGLNKRMMLNEVSLGVPVVAVGAEQQLTGWRKIGNSAHNEQAILDVLEEEYDFSEKICRDMGISRRAMIGLAIRGGVAQLHGRTVVASDLIVPCFNRSFEMSDAPHYLKQPGRELRMLWRVAGELPLRHALLYPKTIDFSPRGLWSGLLAIPNLMNGDAGHYGRQSPQDATMYLDVFDGDFMSQGELYEQDFADYSNVIVDVHDGGGHVGCVSQEIFDDWLIRQTATRDELVNVNDHVQALDLSGIYTKAA